MRIQKLINIALLMSGLTFFFELYYTESYEIFNLSTVFLISILLLILFIFNSFLSGLSDPLKILFTVLTIQWIIFRLHILVLFPETFSFKYIFDLSNTKLNFGLFIIILCILLCLPVSNLVKFFTIV